MKHQRKLTEQQQQSDTKHRDNESKTTIIEALQSSKKSLENEFENLRRDLASAKFNSDKLGHENKDLKHQLEASRERLADVESAAELNTGECDRLKIEILQMETSYQETQLICEMLQKEKEGLNSQLDAAAPDMDFGSVEDPMKKRKKSWKANSLKSKES
ncbi:hypothetical protein OS493_014457 [Desmophyllum pertusum]|uniref:Uncharacterized protein n=1 Tax=Desmophyllum pertusum TaxID=174260 RepID=A0A9W9YPP1_9CNID|nr:hypothetical protein OS493_014457 [Desmophyllum pertusum]